MQETSIEWEEQKPRTEFRVKDEGKASAEPEKGGFSLHFILFQALEKPSLFLSKITIVFTAPKLPCLPSTDTQVLCSFG